MLNKSIIVVAHLDDEALWFSSILNKVDQVVVCFLDYRRLPDLGDARRMSLNEYPLTNIECLDIDEAGTFECADWDNPILNEYGIALLNNKVNGKYIDNFHRLHQKLKKKIAGCDNVFTHNPWGDYGNEDHIQIYRVIKALQSSMGFNLFFTNYCSNRSFGLMNDIVYDHDFDYVTKETNKKLGEDIKRVLIKNDAWTWFKDWEWFDYESFIVQKVDRKKVKFGTAFPINFLKMEKISSGRKKRSKKQYAKTLIKKRLRIFT